MIRKLVLAILCVHHTGASKLQGLLSSEGGHGTMLVEALPSQPQPVHSRLAKACSSAFPSSSWF